MKIGDKVHDDLDETFTIKTIDDRQENVVLESETGMLWNVKVRDIGVADDGRFVTNSEDMN